MKKRYILSAGAIGTTIAGFFLKDKENREKLKEKVRPVTNRIRNNKEKNVSTLEFAGIPDQSVPEDPDQLENAKMVSEGSQFGVQYYNEVKEEKASENNR
ncbi:UDP:flavonoid glycosyltransferase YjiC (YdhE family) [Virgibacillus natechei]|uniref:UDP:flavonoid glycosyltransferase YjiC (YdhE family) n=1 Tax=Virgibacillus natechei TaxID=1216297 RepID=A0ABS4IBF6_9BACI|nr:hypothetical protein [Virgibacillus natechei]MBP1968233.1 UDP:flavonoid glycosyltransferase YjiC (YdhE family) [Virgibacillus natechei]UZD14497.1 hypothetical protein OLD84_08385 [Virgibacillus natechei]